MKKPLIFSVCSALMLQNMSSAKNYVVDDITSAFKNHHTWSSNETAYRQKLANLSDSDRSDFDLNGVTIGDNEKGPNLSSLHLPNLTLRGVTCKNVSFENTNLDRCDFSNSTFENCDFTSASLQGANLTNTTFTKGTVFRNVNVSPIFDYSKKGVDQKLINDTKLDGTIFTADVDMRSVAIMNAIPGDKDNTGYGYDKSNFWGNVSKKREMDRWEDRKTGDKTRIYFRTLGKMLNNMMGACSLDFSGQSMERGDFSGLSLRTANFVGATLLSCNFNNSNLTNANFKGAALNGSSFHHAKVGNVVIANVSSNMSSCISDAMNRTQDKATIDKLVDINNGLSRNTAISDAIRYTTGTNNSSVLNRID